MKTIIAGSRDIVDYALVDRAVVESKFDISEVVSGKAPGVDSLGEAWGHNNRIPVIPFPADWRDMSEPCVKKRNSYGEYNALAGFNRNQKMADYADCLIAITNGSNGTADMIERMKKLGKPVYILNTEHEHSF